MPLDPRLAASNPAEAMDFLRAIKIRSTPSIGGKVKPEARCLKILQYVKIIFKCEQKIHEAKFIMSLASSSCFAIRCSAIR
jgi:hypothetical protein